MAGWQIVDGTDVREGDILRVAGRLVRIDRLEPYQHPDDQVGAGRIAHYPSPHAAGHDDAIVIYDRDLVEVSR